MTRRVLLTKKAEENLLKNKQGVYAYIVLALLRLRNDQTRQGIVLQGALSPYTLLNIANQPIIFKLYKNRVVILKIGKH